MTDPQQPFLIRSYRPSDRAALEALWHRVFPDEPPRNAPGLLIDRKMRVQPELLLICEHDAGIVGAVMAGFDGVRGWIAHLAVAPELRRRGMATQLMREAERQLRALGAPKINLQVRATNRGVVAFYEKLGYEIEERVSMGRVLETAER